MKKNIEFLGLPGSGKSTLYKKLLEKSLKDIIGFDEAVYISGKRDIKNSSNMNFKKTIKLFLYIIDNKLPWSIFAYPRLYKSFNDFWFENYSYINSIYEIIENEILELEERKEVGGWFYKLFAKYQYCKNNLNSNEILVIDEGFCHRSIAIWARSNGKNYQKRLECYYKHIPLPDKLVVVKADVIKCLSRMKKRGRYTRFLDGLNKNRQEDKLEFLDSFINTSVDIVKNKGVNVLLIDNNTCLEKSFDKLIRKLL